jgi:hypothetical protein
MFQFLWKIIAPTYKEIVLFSMSHNLAKSIYLFNLPPYLLWQYKLWSFQTGYIKLEIFLPKNQHTQRNFLTFENWTNGKPQ